MRFLLDINQEHVPMKSKPENDCAGLEKKHDSTIPSLTIHVSFFYNGGSEKENRECRLLLFCLWDTLLISFILSGIPCLTFVPLIMDERERAWSPETIPWAHLFLYKRAPIEDWWLCHVLVKEKNRRAQGILSRSYYFFFFLNNFLFINRKINRKL